jgi:hypothetical protein
MPDDGVHAIVESLDVHVHETVKVFDARGLDVTDVRNSGVVDQDVNALPVE